LSLSTTTMLSPLLIFSPDPLSQDTIFPSVMVLLRAGMKSSRTFALVTTLFETDLLCPPTRPTAFAALVATKLILTFLSTEGAGASLSSFSSRPAFPRFDL